MVIKCENNLHDQVIRFLSEGFDVIKKDDIKALIECHNKLDPKDKIDTNYFLKIEKHLAQFQKVFIDHYYSESDLSEVKKILYFNHPHSIRNCTFPLKLVKTIV